VEIRQVIVDRFIQETVNLLDSKKHEYAIMATYKAPELWYQFEITVLMHEYMLKNLPEWDLYVEKAHKDMFMLPGGCVLSEESFRKGVNFEFKVAPSGDSMDKFYKDVEDLKGYEYGYLVVVYCNVNKDYPPCRQVGLKPNTDVFKAWDDFKNNMNSRSGKIITDKMFDTFEIPRKDNGGSLLKTGLAVGIWKC